MAGPGAVTLAALLGERRADLALETTERLYRARPELLQTWGEAGRTRCIEDLTHNYEHLCGALTVGRPDMFRAYVRWLADLLEARNIPLGDVEQSLVEMGHVLRDRFGEEQVAPALEMIEAGRAVISHGGSAE